MRPFPNEMFLRLTNASRIGIMVNWDYICTNHYLDMTLKNNYVEKTYLYTQLIFFRFDHIHRQY